MSGATDKQWKMERHLIEPPARADMKTITGTRFHRQYGALVDEVRYTREPLCVRAHGRAGIIVVEEGRYDEMLAAQLELQRIREREEQAGSVLEEPTRIETMASAVEAAS